MCVLKGSFLGIAQVYFWPAVVYVCVSVCACVLFWSVVFDYIIIYKCVWCVILALRFVCSSVCLSVCLSRGWGEGGGVPFFCMLSASVDLSVVEVSIEPLLTFNTIILMLCAEGHHSCRVSYSIYYWGLETLCVLNHSHFTPILIWCTCLYESVYT